MLKAHVKQCSRCGGPQDRQGQRYCRACHAAYMRENRPAYSELSPEERAKGNARSMARVYQRRGKIVPQPCEQCGAPAQKHHDDYSRPLDVRWLCRKHHMELHRC
jgi:hypothetical protein